MKILDGMHKQPQSNVNVSRSFVAVIRGEKQKTVMALDSRPLAIDKGKNIIGDPSLVVQNPMKAVRDEKERNQKNFPEGKPMSSSEGQVFGVGLSSNLVGITWEFTCSLMSLDRVILWTDSIFYTVKELMGRMRVMELAVDSMESQASGLEA
nr:hypothetical protein CFP56_25130 [Quercus suber]